MTMTQQQIDARIALLNTDLVPLLAQVADRLKEQVDMIAAEEGKKAGDCHAISAVGYIISAAFCHASRQIPALLDFDEDDFMMLAKQFFDCAVSHKQTGGCDMVTMEISSQGVRRLN